MSEIMRIRVDGIDLAFALTGRRDGETLEEIKNASRRFSFYLIGDSSTKTDISIVDTELIQGLSSGQEDKRYEIIINELE